MGIWLRKRKVQTQELSEETLRMVVREYGMPATTAAGLLGPVKNLFLFCVFYGPTSPSLIIRSLVLAFEKTLEERS